MKKTAFWDGFEKQSGLMDWLKRPISSFKSYRNAKGKGVDKTIRKTVKAIPEEIKRLGEGK